MAHKGDCERSLARSGQEPIEKRLLQFKSVNRFGYTGYLRMYVFVVCRWMTMERQRSINGPQTIGAKTSHRFAEGWGVKLT